MCHPAPTDALSCLSIVFSLGFAQAHRDAMLLFLETAGSFIHLVSILSSLCLSEEISMARGVLWSTGPAWRQFKASMGLSSRQIPHLPSLLWTAQPKLPQYSQKMRWPAPLLASDHMVPTYLINRNESISQ